MSDLVSIASTAVNAYQRALGTVSNNIANVDSVGYTRQETTLSENAPRAYGTSYLGTGVNVEGLRRLYDTFIENSLRSAAAELGVQDPLVNYASRVVDIMGSEDVGLLSAFDQFFDSARQLSTDASSSILRAQFLNKSGVLAERFQTINSQLGLVAKETEEALKSEVASLNTLAEQLALVNGQLGKVKILDRQPPALLDQRDQLLREMSELAKLNVTEATNGVVTVSIGASSTRGQIVVASEARPLSVDFDASDVGRVSLALNRGSPRAESIVGFSGGSISGLMGFRSDLLQPSYAELDQLAVTLASEVNAIHREGIDLQGEPGADLFVLDPQFELTSAFGSSDVLFEAAVINPAQGYQDHDLRLEFQEDAGQRNNMSLSGQFRVGDQISVSLNGRDASFLLSGGLTTGETLADGADIDQTEVLFQLRQFLEGGGGGSEDGAFGRSITVEENATGGLVVSSEVLGAFTLEVESSASSGRIDQSVSRGLWVVTDPTSGEVAQGSGAIEINGIQLLLSGNPRDQEILTLSVGNSPSAGLRLAISEPERVAAAARFRTIDNQFNPGGASAALEESSSPPVRDESLWLSEVRGDDADGRTLDNNALNSTDVVLNFNRVPAVPLGVVPAGYADTALYLGGFGDELVDLQVFTREGVHLLGRHFAEDRLAEAEAQAEAEGRVLTEEERDALIKEAGNEYLDDARRAGASIDPYAQYNAGYLNQAAGDAYRDLSLFYGVRGGVERIAPLTEDHVAGEVQVFPASVLSERIDITVPVDGEVFSDGDLVLNGVALEGLGADQGHDPGDSLNADDISDWIYGQSGWGVGEVQTLYFSQAEASGTISIVLDTDSDSPITVTALIAQGDLPVDIAQSLADQINSSSFIASGNGRSVSVSSSGELSIQYALTDGDPDDISFEDTGSTGVLMERTVERAAPGALGRGDEKTLRFTAAAATGQISVGGIAVNVTAGDTAEEVAAAYAASLIAADFTDDHPLRRVVNHGDGSITLRYPYQEGPVDEPELQDVEGTGVSLTLETLPFEGIYLEVTRYFDETSSSWLPDGLRISQTVSASGVPEDSEVRLGMGADGRPADLALLGFRTGAYLIGEMPEDLLVFASSANAGASFTLGASYEVGEIDSVESLRSHPFDIVFTADNQYEIRDLDTDTVLSTRGYTAGQPIEYLGLQMSFSTPPVTGDRFRVDGNQDGLGSNANAVRLSQLQNQRVVGGGQGMTFSEAYSEVVADVGNVAFQAGIAQKALEVVHDQAVQARDKVSGVSLDEEAADLIRFQQAYQASAKVMQTASTLFDAIIGLR
ncbi:MAG: Flagellar hook-associated protein 1 [Pseudomonadota bacterium]|jgi:flagellar hook-associated protein FlgK